MVKKLLVLGALAGMLVLSTGAAHADDRYNGYNNWNGNTWNHDPAPPVKAPEPGSLIMLSTGLAGLVGYARKFRLRS
jgi:hypothetical protein